MAFDEAGTPELVHICGFDVSMLCRRWEKALRAAQAVYERRNREAGVWVTPADLQVALEQPPSAEQLLPALIRANAAGEGSPDDSDATFLLRMAVLADFLLNHTEWPEATRFAAAHALIQVGVREHGFSPRYTLVQGERKLTDASRDLQRPDLFLFVVERDVEAIHSLLEDAYEKVPASPTKVRLVLQSESDRFSRPHDQI